MTQSEGAEEFEVFLAGYRSCVESALGRRIRELTPEIYLNHIPEAVGGLLARHSTLSIQMAEAPEVWNGHIAPIILRCQIEAHITMSWILDEPNDRALKYIHYGLGQEKLFVEHLEQERQSLDGDERADIEQMLAVRKSWLEAQMADWATNVNVGSWSGTTIREMAAATDEMELYRFAYVPFSGAVHSMWQHVGIYNVEWCRNPMHKHHRVPVIMDAPFFPDFLYRSAKFLSKSFDVLDRKLQLSIDDQKPLQYITGAWAEEGGRGDGASDET